MMFVIKAAVSDPRAETFAFNAQKTMYGGKHIAKGDRIFVFASENEGGPGLIASGVVNSAKAIARKRGIARQTPRVSIVVRRTALANRVVVPLKFPIREIVPASMLKLISYLSSDCDRRVIVALALDE